MLRAVEEFEDQKRARYVGDAIRKVTCVWKALECSWPIVTVSVLECRPEVIQ